MYNEKIFDSFQRSMTYIECNRKTNIYNIKMEGRTPRKIKILFPILSLGEFVIVEDGQIQTENITKSIKTIC